ncbi:MAG: hypothetical protein LIO78_06530 [Clostridiales bacterium]|nr:hypothetical protein [Clostridiales bacterium]
MFSERGQRAIQRLWNNLGGMDFAVFDRNHGIFPAEKTAHRAGGLAGREAASLSAGQCLRSAPCPKAVHFIPFDARKGAKLQES